MKNLVFILILQVISFCLFAQETEKLNNIYPEIIYPTLEGGQTNIIETFSQKELSVVVFTAADGHSIRQMGYIAKSYDEWIKKYDIQVIIIARTAGDLERTKEHINNQKKVNEKFWKDDYIVFLEEYILPNGLRFSKGVPGVDGSTPHTLYVTKDSKIIKSQKGLNQTSEEIEKVLFDFFVEDDKE